MESYEHYKSAYDRDGFVQITGFLPPEEFEVLAENVARYVRDVAPALPEGDSFYQEKGKPETLKQLQHMGTHDPFFAEYASNERWTALAETLSGEPASTMQPEWFNKPPNTVHPTPPHQDNYYFKLDPCNVASIWVAVDPIDQENGCLRYIPGSHLSGVRPHGRTDVLGFSQGITDYGPEDEAKGVAFSLNPGDALIHHGWTIHRADPNTSTTRHRQAFAMVFQGESCKENEEARKDYSENLQEQHKEFGLETSGQVYMDTPGGDAE